MKNMESDKKHKDASRVSNQLSQAYVGTPTHPQAKPPCVNQQAARQVSIRVRLPNGSQSIIKMDQEATVSSYVHTSYNSFTYII